MMKITFIVIGGAFGTLARYAIAGFAHRLYSSTLFPVGTLVVNLVGSFIIGLLWGLFENTTVSPHIRSFIFIGVLGGFTTFSSYSLETLNLLRDGEIKMAFISIMLNNILGIALAFFGFVLVKQLQQ